MARSLLPMAAAALLICASSAAASVMVATVGGDWNDDPDWSVWNAELKYDTDLLEAVDAPGGGKLYQWNAASGDPSPISYFKGAFHGFGPCPGITYELGCFDEYGEPIPRDPVTVSFDFHDFTSFTIDRQYFFDDFFNYNFDVAGPGFGLSSLGLYLNDADLRIDLPIDRHEYGNYVGVDGIGYVGLPHTEFLEVKFAPVPEPTTWEFLIVGFGGLGCIVRRRRAIRGQVELSLGA